MNNKIIKRWGNSTFRRETWNDQNVGSFQKEILGLYVGKLYICISFYYRNRGSEIPSHIRIESTRYNRLCLPDYCDRLGE